MTFRADAVKYLRRLELEYGRTGCGSDATELSLRPTVHEFITSLARGANPAVFVAHEPRRRGRNKPDWRFDDIATFGIYAYGDHKGINIHGPMDIRAHKKQFDRYLELGRPLVVTDGIEFVFLRKGIPATRMYLVPKPLPKWKWHELPVDTGVETAFAGLLKTPGFRAISDEELVVDLAKRARFLADLLFELLRMPAGSGQDAAENRFIRLLAKLQGVVADHHDPSLRDPKSCADFVAQVLVFGLFYAHRRSQPTSYTPTARRREIQRFWASTGFTHEASRLRPFKALVDLIGAQLGPTSEIGDWYQECTRVLAHAESVATVSGEPDYHVLFERFLGTFDNQTKFDRGAFYTPKQLVDYVCNATEHLAKEKFGQSLYRVADKIIDPCCGTGGFLERLTKGAIHDRSRSHLIGFEVLPAPYALAQYRLAGMTRGTKYEARVHILLTDTLSDAVNGSGGKSGASPLQLELQTARRFAAPPLEAVVGNPPSSDVVVSEARRDFVEGLVDEFRPPASAIGGRQNIQKALNNEFVRFLAWSANRVTSTGRGIVALVLPSSFATHVSYKYARAWLIDNFDDVRVLLLDADARSGAPTDSLFQTLQGRMVLFATLSGEAKKRRVVRFHSIADRSIEEKHAFLATDDPFGAYATVPVDPMLITFAPVGVFDEGQYAKCWGLTPVGVVDQHSVFLSKCSAVKTGLTRALFSVDSAMLMRRRSDVGNERLGPADLQERWFKGQGRPPKASAFVSDVRDSIAKSGQTSVTFRPFVEGSMLFDPAVRGALSRLSSGGSRPRPEVLAAFEKNAVAVVVAPAPVDVGSELTRFASFAWNLPDNDIAARGNGMVYCDKSPPPKGGARQRARSVQSNVSPAVAGLFGAGSNPGAAAKAVTFYAYAVLSSGEFLARFRGALFTTANPDSPVRIPIVASPAKRRAIASLGMQIASLERSKAPPGLRSPKLRLEVSRSGGTEFRLERVHFDAALGVIELSDAGGSARRRISGIPSALLLLSISGYHVVQAWLKERQFKYLRRAFRESDLGMLVSLLNRIEAQRGLLSRVDSILKTCLDSGDIISPDAPHD